MWAQLSSQSKMIKIGQSGSQSKVHFLKQGPFFPIYTQEIMIRARPTFVKINPVQANWPHFVA